MSEPTYDREPTDDQMIQLLKSKEGYLDDDGFTSRVLSRLPGQRRVGLRPAVVLLSAALASVVVFFLLGPGMLAHAAPVLADRPLVDPTAVIGAALLAVLLVGGFTVFSEE